jgi:uncharacterized protein involved in exopolysaccharide biosynthesis
MNSMHDAQISTLHAELDAALAEVSAAEQALDAVLRELRAGVRAEKVTITAGVEAAFARVRSSRAALANVRELLSTR